MALDGREAGHVGGAKAVAEAVQQGRQILVPGRARGNAVDGFLPGRQGIAIPGHENHQIGAELRLQAGQVFGQQTQQMARLPAGPVQAGLYPPHRAVGQIQAQLDPPRTALLALQHRTQIVHQLGRGPGDVVAVADGFGKGHAAPETGFCRARRQRFMAAAQGLIQAVGHLAAKARGQGAAGQVI